MEEWSGEPRREEEPDPAGGAQDAPPLMEPEFVSGSVPPPPEPYRPMARRRLALLTAAAVVLGVLAGAGGGYLIQQDRKPTPLPKLIGPPPTQPAAPGPVPSSARPADDRNAVYQADLLKLLLPTPKGAKERERDWKTLSDLAEGYNDPAYMYGELGERGFRRAVMAAWETGSHRGLVTTEISLTQFRDDDRAYTSEWMRHWSTRTARTRRTATRWPATPTASSCPRPSRTRRATAWRSTSARPSPASATSASRSTSPRCTR